MEPNTADIVELGVRTTGYVNHAYVAGDEIETLDELKEKSAVEEAPEEKCRIIQNVGVLSVAFMLSSTTKYGLGNLQSTLNMDSGLGTISLAAMYGGLVISNATLSAIMIRWLGCRWTMVITFLLISPYIAVQYHTTFYSLIPASILAGVAGAPMGVAANKYLAITAQVYADNTDTAIDVVIPRFFGLFLLLCQAAQVWGNLITSIVITGKENQTNTTTEGPIELCGADLFMNTSDMNFNFRRPEETTILTIVYIFVGLLVVSILLLLVIGVNSIKRFNNSEQNSNFTGESGFQNLFTTFKYLRQERSVQLLLPITFWLGQEQAFMNADYTASYVACSWGVGHVGYVMAAYGVTNAMSSLLTGWFLRKAGRILAMLIAFFLHVCIITALLVWHPDRSHRFILFIISAVWGISDSIWIVQVISLYGFLSPGNEESAFSNYDLWLSLGFIVGFSYSYVLCTHIKIYLMLALLVVGMTAYLMLEWRQRSQKSPDPGKDNQMNTAL